MSYSASTTGNAPNVAVSTASTPTERNSSCIRRITSGRVEHEVLVAPLEARPAEVVDGQVLALHPRAERPVEHEHAVAQRVEEVARRGSHRLQGYRRDASETA